MWQAVILGFLAGVFGANGFPHFVRGITAESYPCLFGNSSIPNLIAGWFSLVIAGLLAYWASNEATAYCLISGAVGALLMGLFHAAGLAFGKKP
jgi:hypothetical protein